MLVLRLMLMVLAIICLMDGHAEVSSSTTGIRNRRESPVVKPNESEVQILDRKKKKKPKKTKKPSKKKKPKPKKPKPSKPVTTTQTMTTSTLKTTTILTTSTMETTATTTDSPTTTTTTFKTTTSTTSVTTTSTATTTEATSSTASITTATTTIRTTTTTTTAATTADSGAEGECKATNGKPCIFPFKDGNEDYNECKNHGGTYFWCATAVYESGKYKHWSYCPKDGPCPLEGDGECRAKNNKPCVFPFKDGKKEYNECADHGGQYFWCATGTNSAGKYTAWSECPKDGSCPLPQKTTTPAMTSTATAASTTPLTTGTTVATDQMEEKVLGTLENLVLGESRDDSLQMAHMLEKKLDTIIKDLEGETSKSELSNFDDIPPESGKLNLTLKHDQDDKIRYGTQLGKGLMFVLSTVDSMKSVSRISVDCCLDCTSKYPDTELAEYWETLDTCYCYKKFKNPDVEPKTRASSKFTTKACATGPTTEDKCCNTLTLSASGGAAQHQGHRLGTYKKDGEHSNKPVYKQEQGTNVLHYFRESNQYRWSFASSVNSGGGLSSKLGDSSVCPSDVKQWQFYMPGTTNLWLVDSTVEVDCEEGMLLCDSESIPQQERECPPGYEPMESGYPKMPIFSQIISKESVNSKEKCKEACDDKQIDCLGFLFNTCDKTNEPSRCLLLNVEKLEITNNLNPNIFCKREPIGIFSTCPCTEEDPRCRRCHISGYCHNKELNFEELDICYIEYNENRNGYIPCGLSVARKADAECNNDIQTRGKNDPPGKPNRRRRARSSERSDAVARPSRTETIDNAAAATCRERTSLFELEPESVSDRNKFYEFKMAEAVKDFGKEVAMKVLDVDKLGHKQIAAFVSVPHHNLDGSLRTPKEKFEALQKIIRDNKGDLENDWCRKRVSVFQTEDPAQKGIHTEIRLMRDNNDEIMMPDQDSVFWTRNTPCNYKTIDSEEVKREGCLYQMYKKATMEMLPSAKLIVGCDAWYRYRKYTPVQARLNTMERMREIRFEEDNEEIDDESRTNDYRKIIIFKLSHEPSLSTNQNDNVPDIDFPKHDLPAAAASPEELLSETSECSDTAGAA